MNLIERKGAMLCEHHDECHVISITLTRILKGVFILALVWVFPALLVTAGWSFHQEAPPLESLALRVYEPDGPMAVYNDKNIFDYMNGEADIYLDAGFRQLNTMIYRNKATGAMMRVEAFDMKGPGAVLRVFEILAKGGGNRTQGLGESGWQFDWVVFFSRGHTLYRILPHYSGLAKVKAKPKDLLELARMLDRTLSSSLPPK